MSHIYDQRAAALLKFTEAGADHNCPFCKGRMITATSPGDRIFFLNGARAGLSATVSAHPCPIEAEFFVHLDGDNDDRLSRVSYSLDQFVVTPLQLKQSWMCPFSVKNLCALEDAAIRSMFRALESGARTILVEVAQTLAVVAWGRRLPVDGATIWTMLQVHGFDESWKSEFCLLFDFGVALLVATHRRRPIRKKIVEPMSSDY
jgi:hypothetical protein